MKVDIIRIGNSKGIRFPKAIVEQCGFLDSVEITVQENGLLVQPIDRPRDGWDEAFQNMTKEGDDKILVSDGLSNEWDEEEWTWE